MYYYQFNLGDYASHTRGLSLMEDLAYRRLIDEYYLSERPLNGCPTDVQRLIGFVEHGDAVDYVLSRFFVLTDGFWVHERIESDIKSYKNKQEKASKAGKASAQSRINSGNSTTAQRPLNVRSTDVQPTNNQEPITNNQEPVKSVSAKTAPPTPKPKKEKVGLSVDDLVKKGVERQVAADWFAVRKDKRQATLTATSLQATESEALAAGLSLDAAIRASVSAGWAGFKASWYRNREASGAASAQPASKHTGFSGRDYSAGINSDGSF
jgi:uncharacterized protein YdaU (DUF1376 family)